MSHIVQPCPLVADEHEAILNASYPTDEVKRALFSIPWSKAPGTDAWSIISDDVVVVIPDTIKSGVLLKELNK